MKVFNESCLETFKRLNDKSINTENKLYKPNLYNDHFQNYKSYHIPKAQLIIADIPYNVGKNAYGSNPKWYIDGDNKNGESKLANTNFFDTDENFRITEFMHFCSKMLIKEPKEPNKAPCMIVFCSFIQQFQVIEIAKNYGLNNHINLVFVKKYSPQVLKANMKIVGNCEYAILLYRDKLPKFNNNGKMIFNAMDYEEDTITAKIHPTQKSIKLIKKLISIFTDKNDVVIDPVAGSGITLKAAVEMGRKGYGFEIKKDYYRLATQKILKYINIEMF
jgi:site-specific DNA-methyltransferase (adenine-specific)